MTNVISHCTPDLNMLQTCLLIQSLKEIIPFFSRCVLFFRSGCSEVALPSPSPHSSLTTTRLPCYKLTPKPELVAPCSHTVDPRKPPLSLKGAAQRPGWGPAVVLHQRMRNCELSQQEQFISFFLASCRHIWTWISQPVLELLCIFPECWGRKISSGISLWLFHGLYRLVWLQ